MNVLDSLEAMAIVDQISAVVYHTSWGLLGLAVVLFIVENLTDFGLPKDKASVATIHFAIATAACAATLNGFIYGAAGTGWTWVIVMVISFLFGLKRLWRK